MRVNAIYQAFHNELIRKDLQTYPEAKAISIPKLKEVVYYPIQLLSPDSRSDYTLNSKDLPFSSLRKQETCSLLIKSGIFFKLLKRKKNYYTTISMTGY